MDGSTRTFDEAPPIDFIRREPFMPWWYRRRSYLKAAAAAVILLMFSSGGYVFAERNATTTVSLTDAVGQFRTAAKKNVQEAAPATEPKKVDGPVGQGVSGSRAPAQAASPVTRQPTHAVAAPPAPYLLPPEGVYTYRTTGGEQISVAGAHHDYPPETTATLTHTGGCHWRMENDVIKEHEDLRTFCSSTNDLYQNEQGRWITFYGKREGEDITFRPPQLVNAVTEKPGAKASSSGTDPQGDSVKVDRTYLGRVAITIGSTAVQALRVHLTGTSSGQSQGTFVDDLWLDPATGLTLRWERSVDSTADSFGARVRYTERATFQLESLVPQT